MLWSPTTLPWEAELGASADRNWHRGKADFPLRPTRYTNRTNGWGYTTWAELRYRFTMHAALVGRLSHSTIETDGTQLEGTTRIPVDYADQESTSATLGLRWDF